MVGSARAAWTAIIVSGLVLSPGGGCVWEHDVELELYFPPAEELGLLVVELLVLEGPGCLSLDDVDGLGREASAWQIRHSQSFSMSKRGRPIEALDAGPWVFAALARNHNCIPRRFGCLEVDLDSDQDVILEMPFVECDTALCRPGFDCDLGFCSAEGDR